MPRKRPTRPKDIPRVDAPHVTDPGVQRAIQAVTDRQAADRPPTSDVIDFDLEPGLNKVPHGLGRPVRHVAVTPTLCMMSWAWALTDDDNPHPEREVWITCSGISQDGARIRVE